MVRTYFFIGSLALTVGFFACKATDSNTNLTDDDGATTAGTSNNGTGGAGTASGLTVGSGGGSFSGAGGACGNQCSADLHTVIDCNGNVVAQCAGDQGCDISTVTCVNACDAAVNNKQSVGCEYFATDMDSMMAGYCFAAFVANTWNTPAKISVEHQGSPLAIETFARIPVGQGQGLSFSPYNAATGLPPGEVAILFLTGQQGAAPNCPVPPAAKPSLTGTRVSTSFRIQTDVPVVAYQINPFGGGSVAVTGASLLLPTSAWDTNYIAVNAYKQDIANPSLNIIAKEDNTTVTMVPVVPVIGGNGLPSGATNVPMSFTIHAGQNAQFTQAAELSGSVIQANKPIGFMAGHKCMRAPFGVAFCDHGEQMIPPIPALGNEYVGVMYRPRSGEPAMWRMIGAVDGTQLSWSTPVGGPATLNRGQILEFNTGVPFVVKSQDNNHPFMLFTYMAGSQWQQLSDSSGHGDVDFVISVPPDQYMSRYVFFTDPTYPETNLVVVRRRDQAGNFQDVELKCAGVLSGWQPVGDYEWTRADLSTGDFQAVGNCSNGRNEMSSKAPFGLWVWGWGTPLTSNFTANVSYGYPAGMNVQPINQVVIPPDPK